MLILGTICNVI